MKKFDLITGILLLIIAGIVFIESFRLGIVPVGSGTMPFLLALLLSIFSVGLGEKIFKKTGIQDQPLRWPNREGFNHLLFTGLVTALYFFALSEMGFILSTFLFFIVMLHRLARYRWHQSAILGALVSIGTYLFFQKLGVPLPSWLLEKYFTWRL